MLAPGTGELGLGTLNPLQKDSESCSPAPPHLASLPLSGDCVPSPCHNGGTCLEEEEGVRCLCLPGYGGDLCDVGECVEGRGRGGVHMKPGPATTCWSRRTEGGRWSWPGRR